MTGNMPRGAMPILRSQLAASEPYLPETGTTVFVPGGKFPSPNQELATARPYKPVGESPKSFLAWPVEMNFGTNGDGYSIWVEEAFAKACAEPRVMVPADVVLRASQECGSSNFAEFMQTRGFRTESQSYLDGPFYSVDWTNTPELQSAIAYVGPVKIGIAADQLRSGPHGQVIPGTSGWAIHSLASDQPGNHCASLCGYGPLAELVDLFKQQGVHANMPPDMPTDLCYALFIWNSIGIIDHQSLQNITGEAWVRNPTTLVKNL